VKASSAEAALLRVYFETMRKLNSVVLLTLAVGILLGPAGCGRKPAKARPDATIEEAPSLLTMIQVADPKASAQLVKGFYGVEGNSWRWTMGRFSVLLSPPPNASKNGAKLALRFSVPEPVIKALGPLKLSASVDGVALPQEAYTSPGQYVYLRDVPPQALNKGVVTVDFTLDKHLPPSDTDQRELGIVVTVVGFEPR
jgi:hypothetical protein